jgi:hypothetical protein
MRWAPIAKYPRGNGGQVSFVEGGGGDCVMCEAFRIARDSRRG